MNTAGPKLWKNIHNVALLEYPENPSDDDKTYYMNYYKDFWKVIPCLKCSVNYRKNWEELPITSYLESRKSLFEWTVLLHNTVNKELGKKEISLSEALAIYKSGSGIRYIVIVLLFILLLIFFLKKIN